MHYVKAGSPSLTVSLIKDSVLPSQSLLPPTAHLQNPGPTPCRTSESPVLSPPAVPDRSLVPPILGDTGEPKGFDTQFRADHPHPCCKTYVIVDLAVDWGPSPSKLMFCCSGIVELNLVSQD
jgi:hypothetical protein